MEVSRSATGHQCQKVLMCSRWCVKVLFKKVDTVSFRRKISVGQNVRMAAEDLEIGQPVHSWCQESKLIRNGHDGINCVLYSFCST
ncbi:hypothetical protein OK016_18675 [Vibrio chagasii]|nr:hypothetical protein [Vibrio chagasii]